MNAVRIIDRMERMAAVFPALVAGLPDDEARWKPASGAWSIMEIARHLVDEEALDFGARLRLTLESPGTPWPTTDPERWAIDRKYNEDPRRVQEVAQEFARARTDSVAWLRSLRAPDWNAAYVHPRVGPLRAGMLLASWAAHDALHIRQTAKRLFELTSRDAPEHPTDYAGEWKA